MPEQSEEQNVPTLKPLKEGKFVFEAIQEGRGEGSRSIIFQPPLVIRYVILEKKDAQTGKECYPEDVPMMGFITFDFGMEMNTPIDSEHNFLSGGYEGLTKESTPEDVLMYSTIFDLFHSFCHDKEDPNYSHYNWALYGNLKNRAKVIEK